jgi:hypothetical protein
MQTAEHRSDDNRLAQVVMPNARRHALSDPLMGSSLIEVDLVLANQRIQVRAISAVNHAAFSPDGARIVTRGGYGSHPREMIAEIRDNGQLDWSHSFVVEEGNDVTPPLSNRRLDSTRRPTDLE